MILEDNFLNLKAELSSAIVWIEKENGVYNLYFNNHSGFYEFKHHLNHLYYEFVNEVRCNLMRFKSSDEAVVYVDMLIHMFEILDEQIGIFPDFEVRHKNSKLLSSISKKEFCIHNNSEDLHKLIIYFKYQKKIINKSIKFTCNLIHINRQEHHFKNNIVASWQDELKEFYPEMTRIKNVMHQINNISDRIDYLYNERKRLQDDYAKKNYDLYTSPINFFFESRIDCLKDVLILNDGKREFEGIKPSVDNKHESKLDCKNIKGFQWTESKAALVELIYALYYSNALTPENGSIKELAKVFEFLFNVKLGEIYHIFHELKNRKLEPAKFIDSLKSAFLIKINEIE
ncbi:MAG: RteC domain-containing protein [Carboxylicivirga sp.]|jgi:hypothetical protein|nr:RteC domain-containing protein [Carboxylicivirga sp.]